jgi:hypothetical protein
LSESLIDAADKYYKEKKEAAAVVAEQTAPKPEPETATEPEEPEDEEPEEEPEEMPAKWIPSLDELEEMRVWREVALRRNRKGEGMDFEYLPHYGGLRADVTEKIKAALLVATDADAIKAAFEIRSEAPAKDDSIKALADAINRLAEKA